MTTEKSMGEQSCYACACELNALDAHPNGDMPAKCAQCTAKDEHDFDAEPGVVFDRAGRRVDKWKDPVMTTEKLPPLPETHIRLLSDLQSGTEPGFNAHQMLVYGAECARMAREEERERAAKVCEAVQRHHDNYCASMGFGYIDPVDGRRCADAIRGVSAQTAALRNS